MENKNRQKVSSKFRIHPGGDKEHRGGRAVVHPSALVAQVFM